MNIVFERGFAIFRRYDEFICNELLCCGRQEKATTPMELNNNHTFNLKQREAFIKLLTQAKSRVQSEMESDCSFTNKVVRELVPKLAEEHGAAELIEKARKLNKEIEDVDSALLKLGFSCDADGDISVRYNAPKLLQEALESGKRSAKAEREKVLKTYDVAMLNVLASEDIQEAKKIVEGLL